MVAEEQTSTKKDKLHTKKKTHNDKKKKKRRKRKTISSDEFLFSLSSPLRHGGEGSVVEGGKRKSGIEETLSFQKKRKMIMGKEFFAV